MSLSAMLFGQDSAIHKVTNILGLGIPGLLHKTFMPNQPGMQPQRLGELSTQSAKEGGARPIVFGIGRPVGGNIMYMSQPVIRMVKTYVGKSGGKGGGKKKKQYQDVEHVYRYYAIRVCEGPITGFRRIWRNNVLVYDARKGSAWGAKNNHLFFQNYKLYTGSWDQQPDPMMQSRLGLDIPAYRGTAFLSVTNEDLTDLGGMIPQWTFEVVRSEGVILSSRPYAQVQVDRASGYYEPSVEFIVPPISSVGLTGITLKASLKNTVEYREFKQPLSEAAGLTGITLKASLINTVAPEYGEHKQPLSETAGLTAITLKASLKKVVIDVDVNPESAAGIYEPEVEFGN